MSMSVSGFDRAERQCSKQPTCIKEVPVYRLARVTGQLGE